MGIAKTGTIITIAMAAIPLVLADNAWSHENGLLTLSGGYGGPGQLAVSTCRSGRNIAKRALRQQARDHCRSLHDSGPNALRRATFTKGVCQKVKRAGEPTFVVITGATYSFRCR